MASIPLNAARVKRRWLFLPPLPSGGYSAVLGQPGWHPGPSQEPGPPRAGCCGSGGRRITAKGRGRTRRLGAVVPAQAALRRPPGPFPSPALQSGVQGACSNAWLSSSPGDFATLTRHSNPLRLKGSLGVVLGSVCPRTWAQAGSPLPAAVLPQDNSELSVFVIFVELPGNYLFKFSPPQGSHIQLANLKDERFQKEEGNELLPVIVAYCCLCPERALF